jgi:flagellar hook-associated protein 3 FlgL
VTISNDAGGFLTTAGFSDPQTGAGADLGTEPFKDTVNASLTDIDAALQRILDTRAGVGARLNALETQENMNSRFMTDTQGNLSETQDLDYAEAISRFNVQQVALQAAQQAYAKVQGLSLFNYLR